MICPHQGRLTVFADDPDEIYVVCGGDKLQRCGYGVSLGYRPTVARVLEAEEDHREESA